MIEYSSNGVLSKPYALRDECTSAIGSFSASGGKIIPMDNDEMKSARQHILQKNEKNRKSNETMMYAGAGLAAVSAGAGIIGISANGLLGFIMAALLFGTVFIAGTAMVLIALSRRKELDKLGQCKITAYRFEISEKFYQIDAYPRGRSITCHYAVFGENTILLKKEQYESINAGGQLTCLVAEYPDRLYFVLTGLV